MDASILNLGQESPSQGVEETAKTKQGGNYKQDAHQGHVDAVALGNPRAYATKHSRLGAVEVHGADRIKEAVHAALAVGAGSALVAGGLVPGSALECGTVLVAGGALATGGTLEGLARAALRSAGLAVSALAVLSVSVLAALCGALEPRAGLRGALRGSRVRSTLALGVVVKVFAVHASSLQLTDALAILGTTLI